AVGCPSKGGDASGEGANGSVAPNLGYGVNSGAVDGSLCDEAARPAITNFYFEYDSSGKKPEVMRALDVIAKNLKGSAQRVV
ncbi:peptidoglycan-associated lipoprotein Pal, partial [Pseudomonas aeruginosa]